MPARPRKLNLNPRSSVGKPSNPSPVVEDPGAIQRRKIKNKKKWDKRKAKRERLALEAAEARIGEVLIPRMVNPNVDTEAQRQELIEADLVAARRERQRVQAFNRYTDKLMREMDEIEARLEAEAEEEESEEVEFVEDDEDRVVEGVAGDEPASDDLGEEVDLNFAAPKVRSTETSFISCF